MNQFEQTGGLKPPRSYHNLSSEKKFTCDMGMIIPVFAREMVPGDTFQLSAKTVIRLQPLVSPVLHEISAYAHAFFVPYRLLTDKARIFSEFTPDQLNYWESFITGGKTGTTPSDIDSELVWTPTDVAQMDKYTLWDYLGYPMHYNGETSNVTPPYIYQVNRPLKWKKWAYNLIYNEYFRDETLDNPSSLENWQIHFANWKKDYFTAALPFQQRGLAPAVPIAGGAGITVPTLDLNTLYNSESNSVNIRVPFDHILTVHDGGVKGTIPSMPSPTEVNNARTNWANYWEGARANLSSEGISVSDLRATVQLQKFLERNARGGYRYIEFLQEHFGQSPRDSRLQRPEYVGGVKFPIITSEVVQTSSTDDTSPQGNLAGHGIAVDMNRLGSYTADEYGVLMITFFIRPKSCYQQGMPREDLRRSRYDYYFPEFAHLSEQAIYTAEIFGEVEDYGNYPQDRQIFGYQGRYDELRTAFDTVAGDMRDKFDFWHLARSFENAPALNDDFIRCIPSKRIFAVHDEHGFVVSFGTECEAIRPIPSIAEPGLVDHF